MDGRGARRNAHAGLWFENMDAESLSREGKRCDEANRSGSRNENGQL